MIGIQVLIVKPSRFSQEYIIIDDHIRVDIEWDENKRYKAQRLILEPTQVKKTIEEFQILTTFGKTVKEISASP
jgi:hypothetical protein